MQQTIFTVLKAAAKIVTILPKFLKLSNNNYDAVAKFKKKQQKAGINLNSAKSVIVVKSPEKNKA